MEDILLNSISLQLHTALPDLPIYTDRANQKFKVPALYVYLANAQSIKKLRNKDMLNENVNYSYFIIYKNGIDEMFQQDAMDKFATIRKTFRYLKVKTVDKKEYTFQVNSLDMTFNDVSMVVVVRFKIPYRIIFEAEKVKSLENIIIMKEEN